MNFASLRIGKIDQGTETAAHNHNMRASLSKKEKNVNRDLSSKNQLLMGRSDTVKAINEKIESLNLKTAVRKDANRAIEFVLSASPEYFYDFEKAGITREDWDKITIENLGVKEYWKRLEEIKKFSITQNIEQWKKDIVSFVNSDPELKDNMINLVVHEDEKTLHAHLLVVPVVNGKLSAKQFFTPQKTTSWQDVYAAKTNLARGISSAVQHQTKKDFELVQAAQRGYEKGKKAGKSYGYKKGYEKGLADSQKIGAKLGNFFSGLLGQLHQPTASVQAQISEEKRLKDEQKKKADELVRNAKSEADNRVARVAEREKFQKDRADGLAKDLERTEGQLETALSYLTPQQRDKVFLKI